MFFVLVGDKNMFDIFEVVQQFLFMFGK